MKGYEKLDDVLARAYEQASQGKGKERHANDLPFHEQPMQQVNAMVGVGFSHGQAIKKIVESQNMAPEQAVHELLGAICYLAGSIITLESANDNQPIQVPSKMHEYLDQNYKLQLVDELDEMLGNHPKDWIKVPEGAETLIEAEDGLLSFWVNGLQTKLDGSLTGYGEDGKTFNEWSSMYIFKVLWSRNGSIPLLNRDQVREILSKMVRGSVVDINGMVVYFDCYGYFTSNIKRGCALHKYSTTSLNTFLDYLFQDKS